MENKKEEKVREELVRIVVKVPKSTKEKICKTVAKGKYNTVSDLIRAGIDKELNLQIYKDNLDFIIKELDGIVSKKLDPFIKSQRKINAKYLRTTAINTYLLVEILSKIFGDEMHNQFKGMLEKARKKANYYINKDTEDMTKQDLYDFYNIGEIYRNE